MNPGHTLTRKQRNRIAADRSRRKRQDEHNNLKDRVKELEIVNELLRRENERLVVGPGCGATLGGSLLTDEDVRILRTLTQQANHNGDSTTQRDLPPILSGASVEDVEVDASQALPSCARRRGTPPDHATMNTTPTETVTDPATTPQASIGAVETRERPVIFEPAALDNPLQKETVSPSLCHRHMLAAIVTRRIALILGERPRTVQEQWMRILFGSKKSSTRKAPETPCSKNRLVEELFSTKPVAVMATA